MLWQTFQLNASIGSGFETVPNVRFARYRMKRRHWGL
jgi:hypothetical protein